MHCFSRNLVSTSVTHTNPREGKRSVTALFNIGGIEKNTRDYISRNFKKVGFFNSVQSDPSAFYHMRSKCCTEYDSVKLFFRL